MVDRGIKREEVKPRMTRVMHWETERDRDRTQKSSFYSEKVSRTEN